MKSSILNRLKKVEELLVGDPAAGFAIWDDDTETWRVSGAPELSGVYTDEEFESIKLRPNAKMVIFDIVDSDFDRRIKPKNKES